jgi:uncharacterized UBP type Zn finger protein
MKEGRNLSETIKKKRVKKIINNSYFSPSHFTALKNTQKSCKINSLYFSLIFGNSFQIIFFFL